MKLKHAIRNICTSLCVAGLLVACRSAPKGPDTSLINYTNSIGMSFIQLPAGTFAMGSDLSAAPGNRRAARKQRRAEKGRNDEFPSHTVTISRGFYLGKYEVTQAQWQAVMGDNPSATKGSNRPVENVSWHDAQTFISRLNAMEGTTRYRLPTEAEWEYAARAGTKTPYSFGNAKAFKPYACISYAGRNKTCSVGQENCQSNHEYRTCAVGDRQPNPWGLYDMHGNVAEWVQDFYGADYYAASVKQDPRGPNAGKYRVFRGGSWRNNLSALRSAARGHLLAESRDPRIGFRVAFTADKAGKPAPAPKRVTPPPPVQSAPAKAAPPQSPGDDGEPLDDEEDLEDEADDQ